MPDHVVQGIGFVGVRIDDDSRFASTVSLYRGPEGTVYELIGPRQ